MIKHSTHQTFKSIEERLDDIVDEIVYENHPQALDDDLPDIMDDGDNREISINQIITLLERMKA
jgi:hypothetical protein